MSTTQPIKLSYMITFFFSHRESNSEEYNTGILRRYMKVTFEKLTEVPQYNKILASCLTEEMLVPNTNNIKIIIHTPKSLLNQEVTGISQVLTVFSKC